MIKTCFIPARYESTRLSGKPLLKINNKTIIRLVYEKVKQCKLIDTIIVLTDDYRINDEVNSWGGICYITEDCLNGTERIVNFIKKMDYKCDIIVNVQGDEPFINPNNIDKCIENFIKKTNANVKCSTLHYVFNDKKNIEKRSNGKLILDKFNNIMYGSRNVIPGCKNNNFNGKTLYYGHIGIFAFEKDYLLNYYLDGNSLYQLSEDIEWLKILEDGYRINSVLVDAKTHEIGVDTIEDYNYLKTKYQTNI